MSIEFKLRRGTTAQHSTFTGAEGEVTVDTTKDTLVVHDGSTPGGVPLLKENNPSYTGTLTGGTGVVNLGSGQFYKDTSGNVGIGTSSPSTYGAKLVVAAQNGIAIAGYQPLQSWIDTNDANKGVRISTAGGVMGFQNDNTGGGSYTERMRIDSSGNVGIGTSSPTQKLSVNGSTHLLGGVAGFPTTGVGLEIVPAGEGGINYLQAYNRNNSTWQTLNIGGSTITLNTGGTERARIDSSGNFFFNSGYGSVAVAYGCRVWVNFNGTNGAMRSNGNMSSVTRNATGTYTLNFASALPDANYALTGTASANDTGGNRTASILAFAQNGAGNYFNKSTTSCRVNTWDNNADSNLDAFDVSIAIFR